MKIQLKNACTDPSSNLKDKTDPSLFIFKSHEEPKTHTFQLPTVQPPCDDLSKNRLPICMYVCICIFKKDSELFNGQCDFKPTLLKLK